MRFFSGFSLDGESELFDFWTTRSSVEVVGFSYGAIKALEYTFSQDVRVDRLILLSPAFFNDRDEKFKRLQLIHFKRDKRSYIDNFLRNISHGSDIDMKRYLKEGSFEELKELLYYNWSEKKIKTIIESGVNVEVVIGGEDKIVNSLEALEFFKDLTTTYFIKDANHILQTKKGR
jgi:pimeloyl-ACP methyl ester carboxylesterase